MRAIKTLLAIAAVWALFSAQAFAWTQVAGTGTNGALANTVFVASTSGSCGTTTANLNAGDMWAVLMQDSGASGGGRTYGVSDAFGNTWQAAPGGATTGNGAGNEIWYSILTNPVTSGSHATCTSSLAAGFLSTNLGYRPAGTGAFDTNATKVQGVGTTTVSLGPTPSLACPSGAANCDVCIAGAAWHAAGTTTSDTTSQGFTTIAGTGAGNVWVGAYKFVSATTAVSYQATNTTSANNAGSLACFKDTPAGGALRRLLMQSIP